MQRAFRGLLSVLSLQVGTAYAGYLDLNEWQVRQSIFSCQLTRNVHDRGQATFETRAGEALRFYFSSDLAFRVDMSAHLQARSPLWLEASNESSLGLVTLDTGMVPVRLPAGLAEQMISELFQGYDVVFELESADPSVEATELLVSMVGFRPAYRAYQTCLAQLLPVNFDQVERTAVYFGPNQYEAIDLDELDKLRHVILYTKADSRIQRIYVDGHTDSSGFRTANLELAQKRADEVVKYLVDKGVSSKLIVSRWHGERYPAEKNDSDAGRAKNRRVTIRLEKIEIADEKG